ncbi:hypothetical protein [Streptomyces sp. MBT53]|uniref:hypothetical protein n=1 Tax=Streptomyces sp. MBT53 TaxID=1488384 RepID=UPI0027DA81D9|nr:hypothetical protein [Streptomyces sp. MBT53]
MPCDRCTSRRKISYQNADVDRPFVGALSSGFCNWRIDFTHADTENRTYRTSRGTTHTECKIAPMRNNSPQTLPRYGKAWAEQNRDQDPDQAWRTRRRRAGIAAFLSGLVLTLAFFAFFPGLPHVIDWGAILVSLAAGGLAQWSCRSWINRAARAKSKAKAEQM